jgi:hypothetical protein
MYELFDVPNLHVGMGYVCCETCNGLHQLRMHIDSREDELAGTKEINASYINDGGNYELLNML